MDLPKSKTRNCILISAACFVCYGNTLANDYAYDDSVVITENTFTQRGMAGIGDIFKHNTFAGSYDQVPTLERYRPLSLATFAVERDLFGPSPLVSHLGNLLLFALAACLLYLLLAKLLASPMAPGAFPPLALIAALLFAVHPIHTEIVANIKGRDELLVLAGSLSATLSVLAYLDGRKLRHLLLGFCLFLAALFSKENAITFLAVVPLTVFYYRRSRWADYLSALLPLLVASAIFLVVRGWVLGSPGQPPPADIITEPFAYASRSERYATVCWTLGAYLKLLFFPHPLTIDYHPFHVRLASFTSVVVWLSVVTHVGLAGYAVWRLRQRSILAYGILFYLLTLSIVSNVPFSTGTFMSERFVFVPSVGFAVVIARLLTGLRFPAVRYRQALLLAILLGCAVKTHARNSAWRDDFTLFTTDAKTSANSIKANLAASLTFLLESHKPKSGAASDAYRAKALEHAKRAVAIYEQNIDRAHLKGRSYSHAVMLLGNCYGENGMLEDALRCYRSIIDTAPSRLALYEMIQTAINQSNDVDFKLRSYAEFVQLAPDSFSFNYHLGLLYGKDKHDLASSILYFKQAVDIAPDDVNALRGLAHAYTLAHDYDQAAFYFERIVGQAPDNPSLLRSLRDLYARGGNEAKAREVTSRMEDLAARPGR